MNDRPWMMALEMQFAALRCVDEAIHRDRTSDQVLGTKSLAAALRSAECFSWDSDAANAASLASQTIPNDTTFVRNTLPSVSGWWWLDNQIGFNLSIWQGGQREHRGCAAIAWGPVEAGPWASAGWTGFWVFLRDNVRWSHDAPVPVLGFRLNDGVSLASLDRATCDNDTEEFGKFETLPVIRMILAAAVWLQQRVVIVTHGHIERHRRKQLAREHNVPLQSDVKIVQLRRAELQPRALSADGEPVEWSCRWLVSGHWRNQPYKDGRKLIYILPHVKGPPDRPLRVPTHTVYQVNR